MEWSRLKNKGASPSPRAGHAGVLVGDKWYIVGGESRGFGTFLPYLSSNNFIYLFIFHYVVFFVAFQLKPLTG